MRRLLIPALAAALFALTACGADQESASGPTSSPAASGTTPAAATDVIVDTELRTVTLNVMGMA